MLEETINMTSNCMLNICRSFRLCRIMHGACFRPVLEKVFISVLVSELRCCNRSTSLIECICLYSMQDTLKQQPLLFSLL